MKATALLPSLLALAAALHVSALRAGEVEVLHFWTSPGEAKSLAEVKQLIGVRGHTWKDFAVVGGGGQNAMAVLRQRVVAGQPPASASIKGPAIQEWAELSAFANLDAMASFDHWDDLLPKVVADSVKHKGRYVAVPVNVHRANWLWSNAEVLRKAGVAQPPASFDDFIAAAQKVRAAGFVPVAHGGQPWQEFLLFESVALGTAGHDFYRRAFIQGDRAALASPDMRLALESFRKVKGLTDDKAPGRDWNAATDMVIKGRAAFQFMGDWAKGEFLLAGRQPGRDFFCTAAPGTGTAYTFVVDAFAMFQLRGWEAQKAQGYLAFVLLGKEFQEKFNLRKGSIPARHDIPLDRFDDCGKESGRAFGASARAESLVPSVAIDMALPTAQQASLRTVLSEFWNNDAMPVQDAMTRIAAVMTGKPR